MLSEGERGREREKKCWSSWKGAKLIMKVFGATAAALVRFKTVISWSKFNVEEWEHLSRLWKFSFVIKDEVLLLWFINGGVDVTDWF